MQRHDGRGFGELRPIEIQRGFTGSAAGSVLYRAGRTMVLCTAAVADTVPPWLEGRNRGWITAEYAMLPGSTSPRRARERDGRIDGRSTEIQRLIGRSLRAVADLTALGSRTVTIDCDVLQADGGTRTAAITAALIAVIDAIGSVANLRQAARYPLRDSVSAVSVGLVEGNRAVDLDYKEDASAAVDMNVVMTGGGRFVEIQGAGEEATFDDRDLDDLLRLARGAAGELRSIQERALGADWPFA